VPTSSLRTMILKHGYPDLDPDGPLPDYVARDVEHHLTGRFEDFAARYIPWMESFRPIKGLRILEIGAGTGSSTLAMAQRGAHVDGIDVDQQALEIARERLARHPDTSTDLFYMNGTDIDTLSAEYDMILFFATLEHMTHSERKTSLAKAWAKLRKGGILGVFECPNRLWFFDQHTALANFFHWLPDEVAKDYSRFTERPVYKDAFLERQDDDEVRLARWGRGASYHDIEIALGCRIGDLKVLPSLEDFTSARDQGRADWWRLSRDGRFRQLLLEIEPTLPLAFTYPWLDLLIVKDS